MRDNIFAILAVFGIIVLICGILVGGCWLDRNGVRVYTSEPRAREVKATGQSFDIPIKVRGYIEYDGNSIVSEETIVEFCDVKMAEKQMKQELKGHWKEMRKGCK